MTGYFTGSASGLGDELAMDAVLRLEEVLAGKQKITALKGRLLKQRDGSVLEIRDFEGKAYGGKLACTKAHINLADPVTYYTRVDGLGIDLARLARANAPAKAPAADGGESP